MQPGGGPEAAGTPGGTRRFGDRGASSSFPPRRLSFDRLRTAIEALVASTEAQDADMSTHKNSSPEPVHHAARHADHATPEPIEGAGERNGRDKARHLGRSGSFPVRRSSFDRILDVIHSNEEQGEPADGPELTKTNTTNTRSSASNSGSSNVSGTDTSHAKSNADGHKVTAGPSQRDCEPRRSVRARQNEELYIEPHDGPRDDFSIGSSHVAARAVQQEQAAGRHRHSGAGAAEWYQDGVHNDEGREGQGEAFGITELNGETSPDMYVGYRAEMLRGQSMVSEYRDDGPEILRQEDISTVAAGDDRIEPTMRDSMHGWKYLMSLVKAKLLANDGRGRKLTILCGGLLSQTYEKTLRRYPGTLLTSMVSEEDGQLFYSDKVSLDRHPLAFVEILNAYREGVIAEQPLHIAPETWIHELVHFRMHRANISAINDLLDRYGIHVKKAKGLDPLSGLSRQGVAIYKFLEEPTSSWPAWVLSVLSLSMIVLSIVLVCIETLPEIQEDEYTIEIFAWAELTIVIFFTVEYVARFLVANRKRDFLLSFMNGIDLVAIVPTYVILAVPRLSQLSVAKLFRIMRVLRIFKLSRHSNGLQVLAKTGMACKHELGLLLFCLLVFSLLFSSVLFFAEEDIDGSGFESIPHTMWWAVVTITTVGYGDLAPETHLGRIMGSLCAVMGVVMVALPISVISSTFNEKFREHNQGIQVRARRAEQKRALTSKLRAMFFSTQGRGWGSNEGIAKEKSFEWPKIFSFSRPNSFSSLESSPRAGKPAGQAGTSAASGPNPACSRNSSRAARGLHSPAQTPPGRNSDASRMSVSPKSSHMSVSHII